MHSPPQRLRLSTRWLHLRVVALVTHTIYASNYIRAYTSQDMSGGAITVSAASSANLLSCTFEDCHTSGYGGAVYIESSSDANVISSSFTGCTSGSYGGAVAVGALYSLDPSLFWCTQYIVTRFCCFSQAMEYCS